MKYPKAWSPLYEQHEHLKKTHLKELLKDDERNKHLLVQHSDMVLDLSHEKIDLKTLNLLVQLTEDIKLREQL